MIAKLLPNRVRRTYLGGGRIDAFCDYIVAELHQRIVCQAALCRR